MATIEVWNAKRNEWNRNLSRYTERRDWTCKVNGKVFEGFGTKRHATEYAKSIAEFDAAQELALAESAS